MQNHTWPPAILPPVLPVQNSRLIKIQRFAKTSVWLAGVGIIMSFAMIQGSNLFGSGSIVEPYSGYFVFACVGSFCDLLSLLFGILGKKTMLGKIGLILSILALVSIPALVLAFHSHNGNWPWLTDDDCNCL